MTHLQSDEFDRVSLLLGSSAIRHGKRCCQWHNALPFKGTLSSVLHFNWRWLQSVTHCGALPHIPVEKLMLLRAGLDGACLCMSDWRRQAVCLTLAVEYLFIGCVLSFGFIETDCFQHLCPHHLEFTSVTLSRWVRFFLWQVKWSCLLLDNLIISWKSCQIF